MTDFSTKAFRSFKKFMGELTAVAAGIHVGIQEAKITIENRESRDPWSLAAKSHNVVVNGLNSDIVIKNATRLSIVSLYSGFDLFISDVKSQFHELHGKSWIQNDGDGPFDAIIRNAPSGKNLKTEKLGSHRVSALDYYRLVRNSIAHPTPEASAAATRFFVENNVDLELVRAAYGMQTAPNEISSLSFHDIKLLARVALDVAKTVDADFDPGDARLAELVPMSILTRPKPATRNGKALVGWLCSTYGLQKERAECILDKIMAHKLTG